MTDSKAHNVTQHSDAVEVSWDSGHATTLPHLWLRDNCSCDLCRFPQTTEKIFVVASVPVDLQPAAVQIVDDTLHITWPDGHLTCYKAEDIRRFEAEGDLGWLPWLADFEPARTNWQLFIDDDEQAANTIVSFLQYGACILTSAPVIPDTLEHLAPRLGPLREVLFERIHNVEIDPGGYNVAHTSLEVPPHNDFASYSWPPSVQALHMLVNETRGGESTIVDGWSVLEEMRDEQVELFESLCTMPVPFREFDQDNETYTVEPLVRQDARANFVGLRFSNQLMQAINPHTPGLGLFYKAYHELCRRITDPAGKLLFRLQAGDILILASHRVLHGRNAFEPKGKRYLQDAYFELDNVKNHLVMLQRKSGRLHE